jgi:hypothetical protein
MRGPSKCFLLLLLAACDGGRGATSSASSAVDSQCPSYLECLRQLSMQSGQSAAYSQAQALYGENGGCHQSPATLSACEDACSQAMMLLTQSGQSCRATSPHADGE